MGEFPFWDTKELKLSLPVLSKKCARWFWKAGRFLCLPFFYYYLLYFACENCNSPEQILESLNSLIFSVQNIKILTLSCLTKSSNLQPTVY